MDEHFLTSLSGGGLELVLPILRLTPETCSLLSADPTNLRKHNCEVQIGSFALLQMLVDELSFAAHNSCRPVLKLFFTGSDMLNREN